MSEKSPYHRGKVCGQMTSGDIIVLHREPARARWWRRSRSGVTHCFRGLSYVSHQEETTDKTELSPRLLLHSSSFPVPSSPSSLCSLSAFLLSFCFLFLGFACVYYLLFHPLHLIDVSYFLYSVYVSLLFFLPFTSLSPNCLYRKLMRKPGKKFFDLMHFRSVKCTYQCCLSIFLSFLTSSFSYLPSQIFSLHHSLSVLLLFWQQTHFCLVSAYPRLVNNRAQVALLSDH